MAIRQPSYVEAWDSGRFPDLPTRRLPLDELAILLVGASRGHGGMGGDEMPYHQERSGLVRYHERVVATADGEVIRGFVAVASAIVESWCSDNPELFEQLIEEWIRDAKAADDADKDWRRRWEDRLGEHPALAEALGSDSHADMERLFARAELTQEQYVAMRLWWAGEGRAQIAQKLGLNEEAVRKRVDRGLERILERLA